MRSGTIGWMKAFNLNLGGSQDIIIQVPDDIEIQREEAYAIALIQLQEKIVDGVYPIRQRVWPCLFCDAWFTEQAELMGHVRSQEHLVKVAGIQKLADKHLQRPEDNERADKPQSVPDRPLRRSSEHHQEYMKQYYIRKQLGEI